MKYLKTYWGKCITTDGRCSRKTFWMTFLINLCIEASLVLIGMAIHLGGSSANNDIIMQLGTALVFIGIGYAVVCLIPGTCMGIRRLHDRNMTGWLFALVLFPAADIFVLVMLLLGPKDAGNKWGLNSD